MAKADETDLEWEYNVASAGPRAITPWHTVRFNDEIDARCWAGEFYPNGAEHGCFEDSTTEIGLCAEHYEALIPVGGDSTEEWAQKIARQALQGRAR